MAWWYFIPAVISAAQGLAQGHSSGAQAGVEADLNKANADAKNLVRGARNELAVARGRLARANQAESNRRVLVAGGRQRDAATVNYLRLRDQARTADFETQIQLAEQAGAAIAQQALYGVGGSVVDVVNATTRLRNARIRSEVERQGTSAAYDASRVLADIQRRTIEEMDTSTIMDELDYNIDFANTVNRGGNWLTDLAPAISSFATALGAQNADSALTKRTSFSYANPPDSLMTIK